MKYKITCGNCGHSGILNKSPSGIFAPIPTRCSKCGNCGGMVEYAK